jgi:hypothetical protein
MSKVKSTATRSATEYATKSVTDSTIWSAINRELKKCLM